MIWRQVVSLWCGILLCSLLLVTALSCSMKKVLEIAEQGIQGLTLTCITLDSLISLGCESLHGFTHYLIICKATLKEVGKSQI